MVKSILCQAVKAVNPTTTVARLILDEPASGTWNMAADAAILQSLKPDDPPTLRFYRWLRPTLSLGYFQSLSDRSSHPESESIDVVRRATGGGAIVHDLELTYSLAIASSTRSPGAAGWLYQTVHQCVIDALDAEGISASQYGQNDAGVRDSEPFLCFQRRTTVDLLVSGYKVLGSAQRRGTNGLLQHGSLLLAASRFAPQLPGLIELSEKAGRRHGGQTRCAEKTCLWQETPHGALGTRLMMTIAERISWQMNCTWTESVLAESERQLAQQIEQQTFGCGEWTGKR